MANILAPIILRCCHPLLLHEGTRKQLAEWFVQPSLIDLKLHCTSFLNGLGENLFIIKKHSAFSVDNTHWKPESAAAFCLFYDKLWLTKNARFLSSVAGNEQVMLLLLLASATPTGLLVVMLYLQCLRSYLNAKENCRCIFNQNG